MRIIQNNPMFHVDDNIVMNQNILKASAKNKSEESLCFLAVILFITVSKKPMQEKDIEAYDLFHKHFQRWLDENFF